MSDNRAAKSGVALQNQKKIAAKWDSERATTAMTWIGQTIGEDLNPQGSTEQCFNALKDGLVLCKLANWVKPGSISENKLKSAPKLAFKQMELIGMFLEAIKKAGVKETELFQTVDLYEQVNLPQVILCIESIGRKMQTDGRAGFGKAESKGEERHFTEAQMKAGQNIIGLQMGTNKGASQSGQNFGKGRSIVD